MARFLGIFIIVVNNIKNKNKLFFLLYEIFRWNYGNACCNRLINRSLNCFKSIVVVVVIRDNRILRVVCILFVHPDTDGRHARQQTFYRQTGELEANVRQLQTKQQQAERLLDEVKKEIKSEKLLPLIDFCRNTLKFSERVVQELCKLKKVRLKGDFYSPEFNRKFHDESAAFSFEEDKNRKGHYHICVNDIPLVQWFRQKANEWRDGLGIASARQDKGLKI